MLKLNSLYRVSAGVTVMLLGACAASDSDFDGDFPMMVEEPAVQQHVLAPQTTIVTKSSSQAPVMSSAQPQHNVFRLLDRDARHITKLHKDSTRYLMINQEVEPVIEPKVEIKPEVAALDEKALLNDDCIQYCGEGYFYDRKGAKRGGQELVCTKYPLKCGYDCTVGWNFRYLVDGTNYTCQEAKQRENFKKK